MKRSARGLSGRPVADILRRVLKRSRNIARSGFPPEKVHALRVSIRKFDSAVEALESIDCRCAAVRARRRLKPLFKDLGRLRDDHVCRDLARRLARRKGLPAAPLLKKIEKRIRRHERILRRSLGELDRKGLRRHVRLLGSLRFSVPRGRMARQARRLERAVSAAARSARGPRGKEAAHRLRIAVKKLRYFLETFEEARSRRAIARLGVIQDAIGAERDLENLGRRVRGARDSLGKRESARWSAAIAKLKRGV